MKSKQLPEIIAELKANSKKSLATLLAVATLGTGAVALTSCDLEDDPLDTTEVSASTTSSEYLTEEPTENTTEFTTETPTEEVSEAVTKEELTELRPITDKELEEMYNTIRQQNPNFHEIVSLYLNMDQNSANHKYTAYIKDRNLNIIEFHISETTFNLLSLYLDNGRSSEGPYVGREENCIRFDFRGQQSASPELQSLLFRAIYYHIDSLDNSLTQ